VIKLNKAGYFKGAARIVCTLTGHGLKDPDTAIKVSEKPVSVKGSLEEVIHILGY
jgi:threonine synthase